MLSRFEDAIQKEWLITNGLGGYASSTVLGINTRKYHGLLVGALHPPADRRVFLAKLDEEIYVEDNIYSLGANEFQDGIFPRGYSFLKEFSVSPFPKHVYAVGNVGVQKAVVMPFEKNAVIVTYDISNNSGSDLEVRIFPLINWRHFHSVTDKSQAPAEFAQEQDGKKVKVSLRVPQTGLVLAATQGRYFASGKWIERICLREEARRGESYLDDCYQPGHFEIGVPANGNEKFAITVVADENEDNARKTMDEMPSTLCGVESLYGKEMNRRGNLLTRFYESHDGISAKDWLNWLILATDTFIVKAVGDRQKAVIAGYHWFEAWGRDTFVSMPGLMFTTGRFEDARRIFLSFKGYCKQGLIPNFLPDRTGQPAYNTVDATLWYFDAVLQYLKYTGDFRFVQEQLWETFGAVIENHVKGTIFNIHVDTDGLLSHGAQLTWVDASVDGKPVNPREGKAVEVQALWYNALRIAQLLAERFEERSEAEEYARMAERARRSFVEKFWNPERNCLFDVVDECGRDGSLQPNQIFAVASDFTMLDNAKNAKIVDAVQAELLTPCGLRTLARSDPRYIGVYAGDRASRDKAYHNGTVWPWLLGPFTRAFLKTKGDEGFRREYALRNFLTPLFTKQVSEGGLGTLSEIFDGEPPHVARGCISQAWSVAEPLRTYLEDVMQIRPKHEKEILRLA
jgi:predicted glycogen debranching enzyme